MNEAGVSFVQIMLKVDKIFIILTINIHMIFKYIN